MWQLKTAVFLHWCLIRAVPLGYSVSNWQKVQYNTDLFLDMQEYLYNSQVAGLKG